MFKIHKSPKRSFFHIREYINIGDKMETKEKFKDFVKNNPILLKHVKDGKMTWQNFYEIYDIYGEDKEAWKDYLKTETPRNTNFDLPNFIKGLDLDGIQNGVNSLQRVLSLLQDMSSNKSTTQNNNYKPRPIYKHFDD